MTSKKIFKAWMLSAFYEFQLYLKLNDLWWKGGEVKGYVLLGNRLRHPPLCAMFWHSSCHMQALSMLIYFVRINATFAEFVSFSPFYAFAMFSRLVHLRTHTHTIRAKTKKHTIRRGGHDLDKWRCLSVCRKVPWAHHPQGGGNPPITKVHLSRCDPTPPLYR